MKSKKFYDFSPVTKQNWIDQAIRDLKGGDFEQRLVTNSMEGFPILPFYTAEDTQDTQWIKAYDHKINAPTGLPEESPRHWINAVEVGNTGLQALNEEIKSVLANGADGLIISLSGKEDLHQILKDVLPQYISIWIKPVGAASEAISAFFDWVDHLSLDHSHIHGGLLWDGLTLGFDQLIDKEEQINTVFDLHELSRSFPNFKSICLDTSVYHNAGATAVQELGYGMSAFVELADGLTERGLDPQALFQDLFIFTAVGTHYFMEIAKLKTFRISMHELAALYQVALEPEEIQLFAGSSQWSNPGLEPYNNLLRNTTEAMSAVIGGCNVLHIKPHDKSADVFPRRMARNISNIIKEESYLDRVIDPAAGSYYVENLIHSLHGHAFELLKTVEEHGGWWKLYLEKAIQKEIKMVRNQKFAQLLDGENRILGVDTKVLRDNPLFPEDLTEKDYQLKPISKSFPVEKPL